MPSLPAALHTGIPRGLLLRGLAGSVLLALSGPGAGAVPTYRDAVAVTLHVAWVHETTAGQLLSTFLGVIGIVLLASAWWQLRSCLDTLSPRAIRLVAAVWALPLLVTTPLFSRDVYAYAGQGNVVANHIDPYTYGPNAIRDKWADNVDGVWRDSPAPYGPAWLWLSGRVVWLAHDHVVIAILLLRLLAVLGLVLVAVALPRLAEAHHIPPQRALWLAVANPLTLIHTVGGAHNDAVMIGLLVCGLAVASSAPTMRRLAVAALLVSLAGLVKVPAVAALGFLPMALPTWPERLRAGALIGAVAAGTAVLVSAVTGLGWGWVRTLDSGSNRLSIFSPVTGIGELLGTALKSVGLVQQPGAVARVVIGAALAVGGMVVLALLLRAPHIGLLRALGLTLVVAVALGPIVQPWYLLWGVVLLAAVGGERVAVGLGALSVALCLALLPNGRSLIRPPLYGAPLVAAAALAAIEVRRSTRYVLEEDEAAQEPAAAAV